MKPIKPRKSKLVVNREQIRNLSDRELTHINGGMPPLSRTNLCCTWSLGCSLWDCTE